ncbi:MAG: LamG-like jellyroll fold domain-containing protein [Myxococcaceae bacterium]|nr:LamG-like jellyroll fold domain-containing protein [Myxococcaceae bacterium]
MRLGAAALVLAVVGLGCVTDPPVPCTACDGVCVDLQNDRRHCGACGTACAAGSVCTAGACVANAGCAAPLRACSGVCFDLQNDPGHCGSCATVCGTSEYCRQGQCTSLAADAGPPSCPSGTAGCDGGCFDQQNDPNNCGACGRSCGTTAYCSAGVCTQFPATGLDAGTCIASTNPCEIVSFTNGACVVTPRTCPSGGDCRSSGTCNPTTGACEYTNLASTACNDNNACTTNDVCVNGACVGTAPVACTTPTACFETSVCVPADGGCTVTPKAEGASCDDGDPCSGADVCRQGRCVGSVGPTLLETFAAGAAPNPQIWRVSAQDGGSLSVSAGQAQVTRNARLVTVDDYLVGNGPVRVTGEFTSGVATDWAHVWTRSTGVAGAGFQLGSGVEFVIKPSQLEIRADGGSVASLAFDGGLGVGQPVVFDVFDDGASVSLTVRNKGGANETRLSTALPGAGGAGKIVFGSGNDTTPVNGASGFGLLRVEHGVRVKPTREWSFDEVSPGAMGQVVGGYGLLPDGGLAGARSARFVQNRALNGQAVSAVAPGLFGAAASYASTPAPGRFLEFPSDIIGSTGGDFSVSFWFRGAPVNGSAVNEVFGNRDEGSEGTYLAFRVGSAVSSELDQGAVPGNASRITGAGATASDDLWHHVVIAREGRRHELFIDGRLAAGEDAGVVANFAKPGPYWVGRGFNSNGNGSFDELRVYDAVALNACEVRRLSARPAVSSACGVGRSLCAASASATAACVDLSADVNHCGACGAVCPAVPGAASTCQAGLCGFACQAGFLDCNGEPGDGCEVAGASCASAPMLVSVALDGGAGNASSSDPTVDNSGQLVVFTSAASNLVAGDTNGVADVFLRNLATGRTTRLSTGPAGQQLAEGGFGGTISGDGRFAAFVTTGPAIVPDTNGAGNDVIVIDLATNARSYGITSSGGAQPAGNTEPFTGAFLSSDGRTVMWSSRSTGLFPGDGVQNEGDIHLFDRSTNTLRMASLNTAGAVVTGGSNGHNTASGFFSGQGRWVSHNTFGYVVGIPGDFCSHAYLVDMDSNPPGVTRLVRDNSVGLLSCQFQNVSAGGLFVNNAADVFMFHTRNDLPGNALRANFDIYRRTTLNGVSTRITQPAGGGYGNGDSFTWFLNEQGTRLAFTSTATNLVATDSNGARRDCLLWTAPNTISMLSQPVVRTTTAATACNMLRLSRSGRWAVLEMEDSLSPSDQNANTDVYLRPVP